MVTRDNGAFARGSTIRFDYPAANYKGVRPRMERRLMRVERVRPLAEQPLHPITTELEPMLNRGEVLVTGQDLDKDAERSFYLERMEQVEPVAIYDGPFDVVLCDDESSAEVVCKAPTILAAIAWVKEWLQEPLGLIVGVRRPKSGGGGCGDGATGGADTI